MTPSKVRQFRRRLRRVEREITNQLKDETVCCGVSTAQCHVLLEIGEQGATTISNLAAILRLDKSTLSRTIEGLVRIGLVERVIDPNDRRYMRVTLSDQGKNVFESINQMCDIFYTKVLDHIPKNKHDQVVEGITLLVDAFMKAKEETPEVCYLDTSHQKT